MLNKELLQKMVDEKFVSVKKHPTEELWIYNYTPSAAYSRVWNEVTLICRGLVLDVEYNIIARPFRKFFNVEELDPEIIPKLPFDVYEKMDGSLGIVFCWKNRWIIATRGSFESEQAIKGQEILNRSNISALSPDYTYMFEIIYPENRIVINYDFEDLVLLACIEPKSGIEVDIHNDYYTSRFRVVKKYNGLKDFSTLTSLQEDNKEGFVIKFENNFRMKVKFEEYKRLHRILTGISNVTVWEYLSDHKDINELLEKIPDEFYMWLKDIIVDLRYKYTTVQEYASKCFDGLLENLNGKLPIRKEYAKWVMKHEKYIHGILFRMYDKKDYSEIIWKIVKPKWSKVFKCSE